MERPKSYARLLRTRGLRDTLPREAILQALDRRDYHPTAKELHAHLLKEGYDLGFSTVYLNLRTLAKEGLIRELPGGPWGAARYDGWVRPHIHLLCLSCGRLQDQEVEDLPGVEAEGWEVQGFPLVVQLALSCPYCRPGGEAPRGRRRVRVQAPPP